MRIRKHILYNLNIISMVVRSTLSFVREYFHIPKDKKLKWCIIRIRNISSGKVHLRLGVSLVGSHKMIDVANACFVEETVNGVEEITCLPAKRSSASNNEYRYSISANEAIIFSKSYINDLYFRR